MTQTGNMNESVIAPAVRRGAGDPHRGKEEASKAKIEEEWFEFSKAVGEARLESLQQVTNQRRNYPRLVYWTVVGWQLIVLLIVVSSGIGWVELPAPALVALISTAGISFAGCLLAIVVNILKRN